MKLLLVSLSIFFGLVYWYFEQKSVKDIIHEYILEPQHLFPKKFYLIYLQYFMPLHEDQNILHYVVLTCQKARNKDPCFELMDKVIRKGYFINWSSEGQFNMTPFQLSLIYCDLKLANYFLEIPNLYTGSVKYGSFKEYTPMELVEKSSRCREDDRKKIIKLLKENSLEDSFF